MIEDYRSAQLRASVPTGPMWPGGSRPISRCWTTSSPMWTSWRRSLWAGGHPGREHRGTKTAGRHTAFASNFMPLLDDDTEFAVKSVEPL